ncbi:Anaerobic nitric oxide reductase transcription regulator norR [Leclercia adecarboxylata]|uniref:Anaerobic nitric oxide reductase transcription regulator norR n=1 Tax=Leclercia adecarboxylata TaxID=83655 RepID=A0A4U9IFI8_9ENTR|nr:Anaerobic nitric oxide reductase transcription regulator norR [Leclercia adecarboxylata]
MVVHQNLREATEAFQRQMITRTLEQNSRSWAASARALETDVANLHRLAKRLGLKG